MSNTIYIIQITVYNVYPKGLQLSDSHNYMATYIVFKIIHVLRCLCLMLKML